MFVIADADIDLFVLLVWCAVNVLYTIYAVIRTTGVKDWKDAVMCAFRWVVVMFSLIKWVQYLKIVIGG
jgi:hypothetical protein